MRARYRGLGAIEPSLRKGGKKLQLSGWRVLLGAIFSLILWPASAREAEAEPQKLRAEKYAIEVKFEPERSFLHAKATVTLRAEQAIGAIEMELNPRLNILEVTDEKERRLEFTRSGRIGSAKLLVRLADPAAAGQQIELTFVYEGTLLRRPLDYITKEGILLRDESRWYPAVDLAAFTQNVMTIQLPHGWRAITSGEAVQDVARGGSVTFRTTTAVSSRAIVAAPVAAWTCQAGTGVARPGGSEVSYSLELCSAPADAMKQQGLLQQITELLLKDALALPGLPRSRFTVVTGFPGQRGAVGYSAPGFLVISQDVVKYHDYSGWAPEFLPHEISHQWFPIKVTIAKQEDGWLAESVAEYLAWRYLLEKQPEQARRMVQRAMRDALAPDPPRPLSLGLRLFQEPWDVTHATLYQRGLLVWRTLETVIDRSRVDRALREYYKRFAGNSASISDFRKICEEISGRDLGWFFEYFLNGTQIPEISLRRLPSDVPNMLLGEIVVKNVPADFQVRVEMRAQTEKGAVDHSVATRGEVTPFSLNLPAPATRVVLDPNLRLLRWTEAARRHREQAKLLAQMGELEDSGEFRQAFDLCQRAITLDSEDLAANQQQIHFLMGRMLYRAGKFAGAKREFGSALVLASLDAMDTDFYRAWANVYRARIAKRLGQIATALKEARAGLASKSPAMETKIAWAEAPRRESSAREALREFLRVAK